MVVGYGRILGKVRTISSVIWCMQWERALIFGFGTTLGVVLFPWKSYSQNCLPILWFRKLWFLTWLFLHQMWEVGAGTYFFVATSMNGRYRDFILSMSMFLPGYLGGRVMISWFGSWIVVVFLMCDPFIFLYWKPLLFVSLGRAFNVLRYVKWCLSFYELLLGVWFLQ